MTQKEKKPRKGFREFVRNRKAASALLFALAYVAVITLCVTSITPERYALSVGDIAKKTITASKDVVDEVTTQQRRDAAAAQAAPVYYKDEGVKEIVLADFEKAFEEIGDVQSLGASILSQRGEAVGDAEFTQEDYDAARALLTMVELSNYQLNTLMSASAEDLKNLYQSLSSATRTTLIGTIPEGSESDAINNIQQLIAYNTSSALWWNVAKPLLSTVLQPNMKIDQEATEQNRQKAIEAVEPVVYKQGENIVRQGERVTSAQLALLSSLGLLEGKSFDAQLYIGTGALLLMLMLVMAAALRMFAPAVIGDTKQELLLLIIGLLALGLSVLVMRFNLYAIPIVLGALMAASLIGTAPAYILNLTLAGIVSMLTLRLSGAVPTQVLSTALTGIVGGTVGIYTLRRRATRVGLLLSGLAVGAVNLGVVLCVGGLTNTDIQLVLNGALYSMLGGFIASVLCVGIQPLLETAFNLVTPSKLLELSNPNQPLLRRLMIETPGTYHHSVVVANIAEAAAEAIGANALLVRVGAYYHDIGKLKRPNYFKENQMGENPHDYTDPRVSAEILIAHVRDGVALGQKNRLPLAIIDLIRQHHGDTPVLYFYHKALKQGGEEPNVADFRYDGPKPQTREAAVLMLADTVEAAVRSMPDPTPDSIQQMIQKLVRGKIDDGQMDESPLTFRDIERVCQAFAQVLNGVFHERIEYPDVNLHPEKDEQVPDEIAAYVPTQADEQNLHAAAKETEADPAQESTPDDAKDEAGKAGKRDEA